jgi:hypothetical protein
VYFTGFTRNKFVPSLLTLLCTLLALQVVQKIFVSFLMIVFLNGSQPQYILAAVVKWVEASTSSVTKDSNTS